MSEKNIYKGDHFLDGDKFDNSLKPLHETLEGALGIFHSLPIREFVNGHKVKGIFTSELKHIGLSKSVIKKLVKKGFVAQGSVKFEKGNRMTFYSLRPTRKL